jgi:hypothetical protein
VHTRFTQSRNGSLRAPPLEGGATFLSNAFKSNSLISVQMRPIIDCSCPSKTERGFTDSSLTFAASSNLNTMARLSNYTKRFSNTQKTTRDKRKPCELPFWVPYCTLASCTLETTRAESLTKQHHRSVCLHKKSQLSATSTRLEHEIAPHMYDIITPLQQQQKQKHTHLTKSVSTFSTVNVDPAFCNFLVHHAANVFVRA